MKKLLCVLSLLSLCLSALAQGPIYSGGFIYKTSTGATMSGDNGGIVFLGQLVGSAQILQGGLSDTVPVLSLEGAVGGTKDILDLKNGAGTMVAAFDSVGNLVKIRGVTLSWPAANSAGHLSNDGAGNLTWAAGGSVTSVGLSMPAEFNVANSPVVSSGTLTATWGNENANTVMAGPSSGAAGTPGFRALVAADIPGAQPLFATGLVVDDFSQYTGNAPTINKGHNWSGQTAAVTGTYGIVTNTTDSSGAQNALSITNGEFARLMPWGAKWKKLRIGVLYRIQTNATLPACDMAIGICSGTANPYGSASCDNALVVDSGVGSGNVFTFAAGTDYAHFVSTFSDTAQKHNASRTRVPVGGPSGSGLFRPAGVATARGAIIVQVTRTLLTGSTSYTIQLWSDADMSTTASQSDYSLNTLVADLTSTQAGTLIVGTSSLSSGAQTVSDANGAFNAVDIWWSSAAAGLELDAVAVARFY